jgi:hypothetical protein
MTIRYIDIPESDDVLGDCLRAFKKNSTWPSSHFFISDMELNLKIHAHDDPIANKNKIYHVVHYQSKVAFDGIKDLIREKRWDYYEAKRYMKHEKDRVLLNKRRDNPLRGIVGGWYEPNLKELDADQRRRLFVHEKAHEFSIDRTDAVEKMKESVILKAVKKEF